MQRAKLQLCIVQPPWSWCP